VGVPVAVTVGVAVVDGDCVPVDVGVPVMPSVLEGVAVALEVAVADTEAVGERVEEPVAVGLAEGESDGMAAMPRSAPSVDTCTGAPKLRHSEVATSNANTDVRDAANTVAPSPESATWCTTPTAEYVTGTVHADAAVARVDLDRPYAPAIQIVLPSG
jgi:hypothetical protein